MPLYRRLPTTARGLHRCDTHIASHRRSDTPWYFKGRIRKLRDSSRSSDHYKLVAKSPPPAPLNTGPPSWKESRCRRENMKQELLFVCAPPPSFDKKNEEKFTKKGLIVSFRTNTPLYVG